MKRASQRDLPVHVSQVSLAALLDLVLVLLLAFVVAVPFLRRVKAPEKVVAETAQVLPNPTPAAKIELRIHPDQSIRLDGQVVTGAQLLPSLKKLLESKPESGVLVRMPANFAAGPLARLMEEMHRAGVKQTAVEVVDGGKP
ncbi:MAG: biopolymer transporter ExbD [Verrucomicrobiota bacterium]